MIVMCARNLLGLLSGNVIYHTLLTLCNLHIPFALLHLACDGIDILKNPSSPTRAVTHTRHVSLQRRHEIEE
jgi:hypothetical protein